MAKGTTKTKDAATTPASTTTVTPDAKNPQITIVVPRINIQRIHVPIVGISPLIVHQWSEKAKKEMLDKQMKRAQGPRRAKNPEMDFYESLYWLDGMPKNPTPDDLLTHRFGFPSIGFKAAAVSACRNIADMKMTFARGAFHVVGEFVQIEGVPDMREDMVKVGMGTADLRYRGEFKQWKCTLPVAFNAGVISAEQIFNLFHTAGFSVGVGEWRPEREGQFGMFEVEGVE